MNNHILPVTGHLPVAKLKTRHFIDLLKSIEQKGLLEVAARYTSMLDYFRFKRVKQEIANSIVPNLCRLAGPPLRLIAAATFAGAPPAFLTKRSLCFRPSLMSVQKNQLIVRQCRRCCDHALMVSLRRHSRSGCCSERVQRFIYHNLAVSA